MTINPENSGQVLKKVKATDPDGDIISYSIEPPEFRNLFAVDAEVPFPVFVEVFLA